MRLLVCGRSSLRRKPIEAVFSARDIFRVGVPRARVRWVVFLAADQANGPDVCTVGAHSGRIARRFWGPCLKWRASTGGVYGARRKRHLKCGRGGNQRVPTLQRSGRDRIR